MVLCYPFRWLGGVNLGNLGLVPLGRIGLPIDMGKVVAFLASDESAFVTGEVIYADGGFLTQLRPLSLDSPWPESIKKRLASKELQQ